MAGRKRKAVAEEPARPKAAAAAATAAASVAVQSSPRRTRSATARAASGQAEQKPEPIKKKPKPPSKGKKSAAQDDPEPEKDEKEAAPVAAVAEDKTIIIEACKQCNSFKTRASLVKEGLEKGVPGVTVTINPEKPRKGCFEVRTGSGNTFISLLNMPRPFKKMKDLDMDEVIEDIVKKLNE